MKTAVWAGDGGDSLDAGAYQEVMEIASPGPKLTVMDLLHLFVYYQTNSGNLPGLFLQYNYFRLN